MCAQREPRWRSGYIIDGRILLLKWAWAIKLPQHVCKICISNGVEWGMVEVHHIQGGIPSDHGSFTIQEGDYSIELPGWTSRFGGGWRKFLWQYMKILFDSLPYLFENNLVCRIHVYISSNTTNYLICITALMIIHPASAICVYMICTLKMCFYITKKIDDDIISPNINM